MIVIQVYTSLYRLFSIKKFDSYWYRRIMHSLCCTFYSSKMTMGQCSDLIVQIMIFVVHNFGDKTNTFLFINIARNFY